MGGLMGYRNHPAPKETRVWTCEDCGQTYTQKEVNGLEWYDGYRCSKRVDGEDDLLCGGLVLWKKVED
jgi:hypothetical protein